MRRGSAGIALVLLPLLASVAAAQIEGKPFVEEEKRRALEQDGPPPPDQPFLWDWGGWVNGQYLSLGDEPVKDVRQQRWWDLRVWGSATLSSTYRIYARVRNTYQDWNSGDQFGVSEETTSLLRLDQGYVEAYWTDAAVSMFGEASDLHARAGRQTVVMGTGLLLNGTYDGAQFDGFAGPLKFRLFGVHTIVNEDDIDRSLPNHDDSHRLFVGAEAEYGGLGWIRPSLLLLVERDFNRESDPAQDYDYNASYAGVGVRGVLPLPGLFYRAEFDYQGGTSVAVGGTQTEAISAWALVAMLDYHPALPTSPTFGATYVRATGDPDRGSPTDTSAGNVAGSDDSGFLSFGFLPSGYALFPRISNLHLFRVSATFKPLESLDWAKALEIGVAFYKYSKDESAAGISDPRAFNNDSDVGTAVDVSLRWRLLSDAALAVDFGRFMPGGAYDETADRDFIAVSLTYSF